MQEKKLEERIFDYIILSEYERKKINIEYGEK